MALRGSTVSLGHDVIETDERAPGFEPDLRTRFYSRAYNRALRLNRERKLSTYRWAVVRNDSRYEVVAMQNVARPR